MNQDFIGCHSLNRDATLLPLPRCCVVDQHLAVFRPAILVTDAINLHGYRHAKFFENRISNDDELSVQSRVAVANDFHIKLMQLAVAAGLRALLDHQGWAPYRGLRIGRCFFDALAACDAAAALASGRKRAADVEAIGCHGQTVRHRPEKGFTIQLNPRNAIGRSGRASPLDPPDDQESDRRNQGPDPMPGPLRGAPARAAMRSSNSGARCPPAATAPTMPRTDRRTRWPRPSSRT